MQRIEEVTTRVLGKMGDDRYRPALVVAQRAEQLVNGTVPLVSLDKNKTKFADIVLFEIAGDKIVLGGFIENTR